MNGCVYQTADKQCMKFTDKMRNTMSWCVGNNPCEFRKPSNADRIRGMSDEELVNFFWNWCDGVECKGKDCNECIEIWLKQEAKE